MNTINSRILPVFPVILLSAFVLGGCGNSDIRREVNSELVTIRGQMDEIRKDVEINQDEIALLQEEADRQRTLLEEKAALIDEALSRADGMDKLRHGRLLYEITISDESVPFGFNESKLSGDARKQLDIFAGILIEENEDVYIEVQGHTDSSGSRDYNLRLGQERADAVVSYLHTAHNLPLHRMAAFSYGESRPVVKNDSRENRAKNRRAVLIVME